MSSPQGEAIAKIAAAHVGCSAVERVDVYTDVVIRPVDRTGRLLAFYTRDPRLSTCSLLVVGVWRLAGIDEPETTASYFPAGGAERDAFADEQHLAKRHGAWMDASAVPPALEAGDAWVIANDKGGDGHTGICTSDAVVDGDTVHVDTVEGGQASPMGSTATGAFTRTLTKSGGKWMLGSRELLGWARAALLPIPVPGAGVDQDPANAPSSDPHPVLASSEPDPPAATA